MTPKKIDEEWFLRQIRTAKRAGVNVAAVFVECEERLILMRVKAFGLVVSIIWCFAGPHVAIHAYKSCIEAGIPIDIPIGVVFGSCWLMGFLSILAFGFDLVKVDFTGKGISFRKEARRHEDDDDDWEITWSKIPAIDDISPIDPEDGVDGGV